MKVIKKSVRLAVLLTVSFCDVVLADEITHINPVIIDDLATLEPGKVVSAAYLFDSVVTNGSVRILFKDDYVPRRRGFVDLDKDGHEDVILSAPMSQFGTGGGSFWIYLWTNGNYRCIGEIGSHPDCIQVEDEPRDGLRRIWTYWRSSGTSGSVACTTINHGGIWESGCLPITFAGEGDPSVGRSLVDAIDRHAIVPVRWEYSVVTNGVISWKQIGGVRKPRRKEEDGIHDEIQGRKQQLAAFQEKLAKAEGELKITKSKLEMFERGILDVSGVELGSKWQNPSTNIVCSEVCSGFTNMNVSVTEDGYVKSIRIVRHAGHDGKGLDGITGGRFPSDEEQKIIHQAENHFHVRFVMDRYPGTYRWENPFERVKMRIDFRDKSKSIIEADYLRSFTE